jgi:NADH:ubiquinone oxidoreductase subunit 6 (subunit J)
MGGGNNVHPINWHSVFFLLYALLAGVFALCVVFSSNIVRMAFYLVLSLGATAGLFFLAGADFVGSMQLLIYVGGTLVLLVFGVMLTAQGPFITMKTSSGDWILAALVGGSLLAVLLPTAFKIGEWQNKPTLTYVVGGQRGSVEVVQHEAEPVSGPTATRLGMGLLGARVDSLDNAASQTSGVLSGYLLPFEIVSVHLLVVLIGAAYLARAKRRVRPRGAATDG